MRSSHGLPIHITQMKKMSDTMPKRTQRVGRTFFSRSRRSEINEFIMYYNGVFAQLLRVAYRVLRIAYCEVQYAIRTTHYALRVIRI